MKVTVDGIEKELTCVVEGLDLAQSNLADLLADMRWGRIDQMTGITSITEEEYEKAKALFKRLEDASNAVDEQYETLSQEEKIAFDDSLATGASFEEYVASFESACERIK